MRKTRRHPDTGRYGYYRWVTDKGGRMWRMYIDQSRMLRSPWYAEWVRKMKRCCA